MELFFREAGSGEPLVIMHGLFGLSDNWNALAKKFAEHFHVVVPDLRNHGQSPHSDEWNYSVMARDIEELCSQKGFSRIHLLGHSMGGKVAMKFSQQCPHLLDKLVVADISPRYYPVHHNQILRYLREVPLDAMASRKSVEELFDNTEMDYGTKQFLLKNLFWKDLPGGEKKLRWRFNLDVIADQIENIGESMSDADPYFGETLFIRGEKSNYITDEDLEEINRLFPRAVVHTVADAGHWLHADKPEEFFTAVMDFLR